MESIDFRPSGWRPIVKGDGELLVVAAVLVVISMFLVAIEQAMTRVSKSRVLDMVSNGVRGSDRLLVVINDRARYINVILMLRMATQTFAVVFVAVEVLQEFPQNKWRAIAVAGVCMWLIGFVVLGVAARTLGQQHPVGFALRGARLARILSSVSGLLAKVLITIGNAITPGKGYREGPFATQAELREMVDLAEADDVIEADERQMIHSVFELGDTIAREVMVPRTEMVWIERDKSLRQALSLALRSGFSRIPVIGDSVDDIVGIVYIKDLARRSFEHHSSERSEKVSKIMRSVAFVPDSKPADELLREMQADRVHVAIVVDEYGGTAGLVTIEDIVEEIVGEITDEYDVAETPESEELPDGAWRVSSRMQLDDLAELLELDISEDVEGVETVGGLLARRLGFVPIPGSQIDVEGYHLIAESAAGRRNQIGTVLVTSTPATPQATSPYSTSDEVASDSADATSNAESA
ncbi:MAG: hemolysin family protein [Candidatus Nanopelagicales bacterium]|nr:HlyC/CorC family transporter [Candidatus Nanopelagicales bacterium]